MYLTTLGLKVVFVHLIVFFYKGTQIYPTRLIFYFPFNYIIIRMNNITAPGGKLRHVAIKEEHFQFVMIIKYTLFDHM